MKNNEYAEYIASCLCDNIEYAEYLSGKLISGDSYEEYIASCLDPSYSQRKKDIEMRINRIKKQAERKEKLNKIYEAQN